MAMETLQKIAIACLLLANIGFVIISVLDLLVSYGIIGG